MSKYVSKNDFDVVVCDRCCDEYPSIVLTLWSDRDHLLDRVFLCQKHAKEIYDE